MELVMELRRAASVKSQGKGKPHRQHYQHPMHMPKILRRVLGFLSVEDLKASRLVCHLWHSLTTPFLSPNIQPILLHDKVDWKKFLKVFSKSMSPKMSKLKNLHPFHSFAFFSSYPEDPAATPYKTAILDYMHSKYKLPRKTLWDIRFFSTFGVQITELKLVQFNLYTEKVLREFREMISSTCPNLVSLTLQFQKESGGGSGSGGGAASSAGGSTSSASTPTPSPSPSPGMMPANENVFFPPDEDSQRKTLSSLKSFTFATDNKCYLNPHALEEFMTLMPSLEEFTYRHTGAKKQWTLVRRVDIIDILCNIINAGHYSLLKKLDLDSDGTVLSGEDFRKFGKLRRSLKLRKFACQVFIKTEPDWDHLCGFLCKLGAYLENMEIELRTHFQQLLSEQELPRCFPRVTSAKLLLDSNLTTFLKRMPNVDYFIGVYDNELVPLNEAESDNHHDRMMRELRNGRDGEGYHFHEGPSCPTAKYLKIQGNDEFGLDVEWKSRVFCNIQSFETDIYFEDDLRLIWLHLQAIRKLVLHLKTSVPEQAFTGAGVYPISPSSFKGGSSSNEEDLHDKEHLSRMEEYPHIGLIKNLEVLEIFTGSRQDAYGSQFSASIIIYGAAVLDNLQRLVLPPAIPPKCLEDSLRYLSKLKYLTYLSVCDDTFNSVLPFHMLKLDLPNLEIVVRYYQPEIKRQIGQFWKLERFAFPDFLPEHGRKCMEKRHSSPSISN